LSQWMINNYDTTQGRPALLHKCLFISIFTDISVVLREENGSR